MIMADYPPTSAAYQPVYQQLGTSSEATNDNSNCNFYQFETGTGNYPPSTSYNVPTTMAGQFYLAQSQQPFDTNYYYQSDCAYQQPETLPPQEIEYYLGEEISQEFQPPPHHQSSIVLPPVVLPPFSHSQTLLPDQVGILQHSSASAITTSTVTSSHLTPPIMAPSSSSSHQQQTRVLSHLPQLFHTGVAGTTSGNRPAETIKLSRLEARRKRNREAAQRCRTNRIETIKRLEKERAELLDDLQRMRDLIAQYDPRLKKLDASYLELTERHYCLVPFKKAT